jgi:hypothetical protein
MFVHTFTSDYVVLCVLQAHVEKYNFCWSIQDFTLCSEEVGEVLMSPIFAAGAEKVMQW